MTGQLLHCRPMRIFKLRQITGSLLNMSHLRKEPKGERSVAYGVGWVRSILRSAAHPR